MFCKTRELREREKDDKTECSAPRSSIAVLRISLVPHCTSAARMKRECDGESRQLETMAWLSKSPHLHDSLLPYNSRTVGS